MHPIYHAGAFFGLGEGLSVRLRSESGIEPESIWAPHDDSKIRAEWRPEQDGDLRYVWLPIPTGFDASEVNPYYYHRNGPERGWYPTATAVSNSKEQSA